MIESPLPSGSSSKFSKFIKSSKQKLKSAFRSGGDKQPSADFSETSWEPDVHIEDAEEPVGYFPRETQRPPVNNPFRPPPPIQEGSISTITPKEEDEWKQKAIGKRLIERGESVALRDARWCIQFYRSSAYHRGNKLSSDEQKERAQALQEAQDKERRQLAMEPSPETDFWAKELPWPSTVFVHTYLDEPEPPASPAYPWRQDRPREVFGEFKLDDDGIITNLTFKYRVKF